MAKRVYLVPTHMRTREQARRIDVTDKSERERERILNGLLANLDMDKWFVGEIIVDE